VADEKSRDASHATQLSNEISQGTGEFDARFLLWRTFCAENNVPLETMPGDLRGEVKDLWDKLKSEKLKAEKP
jgi:hypothetical protein